MGTINCIKKLYCIQNFSVLVYSKPSIEIFQVEKILFSIYLLMFLNSMQSCGSCYHVHYILYVFAFNACSNPYLAGTLVFMLLKYILIRI